MRYQRLKREKLQKVRRSQVRTNKKESVIVERNTYREGPDSICVIVEHSCESNRGPSSYMKSDSLTSGRQPSRYSPFGEHKQSALD